MFQFPRLPPTRWVAGPRLLGSPIRAPRDRSPCAAPPGLSRLAAPFVGSLRQGIRRAPFIPSGRWAPPASDQIRSLEKSLPLRAMRLSGCPLMTHASHGGRTLRGRGGLLFHPDVRLRLSSCLPRKEVIQPHLPVRLPCYDFTPLAPHTFGASPLAVGPATSGADDSGGVTGGVYKARERIHRGVLIRDY